MQKLIVTLSLFIVLMLAIGLNAQAVFINEIHYDNDGGDLDEGAEVAGPAGTDLTDYQLVPYNGNGGVSYSATTLSGTISDQQNGFGTIWFAISGLQNGAPDGIALVDDGGVVIQFLSYEGSFDATDGPASGMTSTDIGVSEGSTSTVGYSLQLIGSGSDYTNFTWSGPIANTMGAVNTGQILTGGSVDNPPSISNIEHTPKVPTADENTTVTATIKDDSGLTLYQLKYAVNGGTIVDVVMTNTLVDTFTAEIPSSEYVDGDVVKFWIYAEDDATSPQATESDSTFFFAGTTTISAAKDVDADGVMLYNGVYARLVGVATVANGTFSADHMDVYIQDVTGGINLFMYDEVSHTITIGHEYTVVGVLDQYNGKGEIMPDNVADITDEGDGTVPDVTVITIDNLMADPEAYEGMLLQIVDADYVSGTWPSSITLNDGGTENLTMYIDSDTDIDESLEGDYPMDVTGIFSQYDFSSPFDGGYQILPRSVTDLNWGSSAIERMDNSALINKFKLHSNFPNPFNPTTTLQFDVPKQVDNLDLSIYNTAGQKVATLYNGSVAQGSYQYTWNGVNQANQAATSGVYFAVLKTTDFTQSIKMMLIK